MLSRLAPLVTGCLLTLACLFLPAAGARGAVYAASDPGAYDKASSTGGYLDCSAKPVAPHPLARDTQLAAWLWQWSKQQVQLPAGWDLPAAAAAPAGQQEGSAAARSS
jgi:hypothetical protein